MNPKFQIQNLRAGFDDRQVLENVSLDIPARGVTAIIGPSGCGKTTFIRCLNRMHELTHNAYRTGTVLLDGQNLYHEDADPVLVRRRVGMVFQTPNPFPNMSIRENVLAGLRFQGIRRTRSDDALVESVLVQAGLWSEVSDLLDRRGAVLSEGQRQRLCIARLLAVRPEVLLMDEPAASLDPVASARVEDLIHSLKDQYTIVIVTHDMKQAARLSDHTAFFLRGELVEFDQSKTLFTSPRDPRTEAYITRRYG